MVSAIDPTKPVDSMPAVKAELRANLRAAKTEIEALEGGKADVGHQHLLGDITDAGAPAELDQVGAGDIAPDALDSKTIDMQDQLLARPEIRDCAEMPGRGAQHGTVFAPGRA